MTLAAINVRFEIGWPDRNSAIVARQGRLELLQVSLAVAQVIERRRIAGLGLDGFREA